MFIGGKSLCPLVQAQVFAYFNTFKQYSFTKTITMRLPLLIALGLTTAGAEAQVDARLFRYPDVSASHISFVYGGDIWTVPKAGGTATKLTSSTGEESFPRFSPDGKTIVSIVPHQELEARFN